MPTIRTIKKASLFAVVAVVVSGCTLNFNPPQNAGVFFSNTNGETWEQRVFVQQTEKSAITIASYDVVDFIFHPTDENVIYVATREAGIYKTIDKGRTWAPTVLNTANYSSFTLDPKSPTIQYAVSGGIILKSTDDGATWNQIYVERAGVAITALAVNPETPNIIWAGNSSGGMLISYDYGNTWELNTILLASIGKIIIPNVSPSTMYVLLQSGSFIKSVDGGATWNLDIGSSLATFPGSIPIQSFYLRPKTAGDIVIGSAYGILRSTDGGTTWKSVATILPNNTVPINSVVIHPVDQEEIFFTAGNIFYSSHDGGETWKTLTTIPTTHLITKLEFNENNYGELFAGITKIIEK